jgi:hypothetical protein
MIFAMGPALRLLVNGEPPAFLRGTPRGPYTLLKLLLAHENRMHFADACIALWPSRSLGEARGPMDTLILRLRRVLGRNDALTVHGSFIELNPRVVWVDAAAVRDVLHALLPNLTHPNAVALCEVSMRWVLDHYAPFLSGCRTLPWVREAQDRERGNFVQKILAVGKFLDDAGRSDLTEVLYQRAFYREPAAIELERALSQFPSAIQDVAIPQERKRR